MAKRFFILFFAGFFLLGNGSHFFYLKMVQYFIQEEMQNRLSNKIAEEELIAVTVASRDQHLIRWEERGKEFSYNGNMYDVVKCVSHGEKTTYYCLNDEKETMLITGFIRHQQQNEFLRKIMKRFDIIKFYPKNIPPVKLNFEVLSRRPQVSPAYDSSYPEISDPPPKLG